MPPKIDAPSQPSPPNLERYLPGARAGRVAFDWRLRLKGEYACPVILEPRGFKMARWLRGGWPEPSRFWGELVEDGEGNPAILFENDWQRRTTGEKNPTVAFLFHPDM